VPNTFTFKLIRRIGPACRENCGVGHATAS
jgi:hypothetical protein